MTIDKEQLERYALTYGVYEHILALQALLAQISSIYVVVTGGLWAAVTSSDLDLDVEQRFIILGLHFLASVWLVPLFIGITGAVRLRFLFLEKIGVALFPDLKQLGEDSFNEAYGGPGEVRKNLHRASWGKHRWFWFIFPVLGGLGSLVLSIYV